MSIKKKCCGCEVHIDAHSMIRSRWIFDSQSSSDAIELLENNFEKQIEDRMKSGSLDVDGSDYAANHAKRITAKPNVGSKMFYNKDILSEDYIILFSLSTKAREKVSSLTESEASEFGIEEGVVYDVVDSKIYFCYQSEQDHSYLRVHYRLRVDRVSGSPKPFGLFSPGGSPLSVTLHRVSGGVDSIISYDPSMPWADSELDSELQKIKFYENPHELQMSVQISSESIAVLASSYNLLGGSANQLVYQFQFESSVGKVGMQFSPLKFETYADITCIDAIGDGRDFTIDDKRYSESGLIGYPYSESSLKALASELACPISFRCDYACSNGMPDEVSVLTSFSPSSSWIGSNEAMPIGVEAVLQPVSSGSIGFDIQSSYPILHTSPISSSTIKPVVRFNRPCSFYWMSDVSTCHIEDPDLSVIEVDCQVLYLAEIGQFSFLPYQSSNSGRFSLNPYGPSDILMTAIIRIETPFPVSGVYLHDIAHFTRVPMIGIPSGWQYNIQNGYVHSTLGNLSLSNPPHRRSCVGMEFSVSKFLTQTSYVGGGILSFAVSPR